MHLKREISLLLSIILTFSLFFGCSQAETNLPEGNASNEISQTASQDNSELSSNTGDEKTVVRLGALKGPSSLGLLGVMDKNDNNETGNIYDITVEGAPADIQARLINGELDIAALPVNLASVLYNKTEKNISVIAVSTLGVLYLLSRDDEISSLKDLEGKTLYATAQGSTPEYVLDYLLEKNGLKDKVNVEYKGEHSELASLMVSGNADIAMLPQPFVTTVTSKDENIKIIVDLNDEWRKAAGTELAMTCIVVQNKFLETNKNAVDKFLDEYKESAEFVNNNVAEAAALSEKYDIIPEAVALKAIPKCAIVFLEGDDIKTSVPPLLKVLYDANPQSVGGALPDDAFYYKR